MRPAADHRDRPGRTDTSAGWPTGLRPWSP